MKVLYINENRHERVLRAVANPENENVYIIPKKIDGLKGKQYLDTSFSKIYPGHQFNFYYRYLLARDIISVIKEEKPDIVHYVSADDYLRMFGFSLGMFSEYNFVLTLHWCRHTFLRDISRKLIIDKAKGVIFHVKNAPTYRSKNGDIKSTFLVLPPENVGPIVDKKTARDKLGLDPDKTIYSFVGLMEDYKGIDILMNSVQYITEDVVLVLAGKPGKYTEKYFDSYNSNPHVKFHLVLRFLTDEEFTLFICASDYVLLPYKKEFEATSGAMTEAIRCGVPIIAPNHENLGILTNEYNLGYTFEVENARSLAEIINFCKNERFEYTEKYYDYKNKLSVENYRREQQEFYNLILKNNSN